MWRLQSSRLHGLGTLSTNALDARNLSINLSIVHPAQTPMPMQGTRLCVSNGLWQGTLSKDVFIAVHLVDRHWCDSTLAVTLAAGIEPWDCQPASTLGGWLAVGLLFDQDQCEG